MAKVKIYLDPIGNTMNIWWNDPKQAVVSEEVKSPYSNDVIVKDKHNVPIGLEIIGVFPEELNVAKLVKDRLGIKKNIPFLLEGQQTGIKHGSKIKTNKTI